MPWILRYCCLFSYSYLNAMRNTCKNTRSLPCLFLQRLPWSMHRSSGSIWQFDPIDLPIFPSSFHEIFSRLQDHFQGFRMIFGVKNIVPLYLNDFFFQYPTCFAVLWAGVHNHSWCCCCPNRISEKVCVIFIRIHLQVISFRCSACLIGLLAPLTFGGSGSSLGFLDLPWTSSVILTVFSRTSPLAILWLHYASYWIPAEVAGTPLLSSLVSPSIQN